MSVNMFKKIGPPFRKTSEYVPVFKVEILNKAIVCEYTEGYGG